MRAARIVLDASGFIRGVGLPDPQDEAFGWLEAIDERRVEALVPELLYAEVANGLLVYVRASALDLDRAASIVDRLSRLPLTIFSLRNLAAPSLSVASARGLSAYDACYVVLAEQARATLVTADRDLTDAMEDVILLA
jgi:predicted nucleic acid-binding protein